MKRVISITDSPWLLTGTGTKINQKALEAFQMAMLAILELAVLLSGSAFAQSQSSSDQTLTFHASSSLVLLDVFTLDPKTGLPLNKLKREDFQVIDNGYPVSLAAFESGALYDARPVALWLVPLCNMKDWGDLGSGLFLGKAPLFRPALDHLDKHDTIAVAHWCDNGESTIDFPPTHDSGKALDALEVALQQRDFNHPVCTAQREASPCLKGEHALQRVLQLILENAHQTKPQPVPL